MASPGFDCCSGNLSSMLVSRSEQHISLHSAEVSKNQGLDIASDVRLLFISLKPDQQVCIQVAILDKAIILGKFG